ncbi:MAG TPA: FkbM family methyltransferase [Mucilaginibacter sp.]|nr:FkbM family methyltransferase [Mucilaginibacter sp.]
MSIKTIAGKILANNPVSRIYFFLFKKRISFNHLTIRTIAFMLRQRIPFHGLTIDVSEKVITPLTKSLLYYQIYEKPEVTFVQKHLAADDDVIELGSSIGVMGSIVSRIQTSGRYISVEADPALINANNKNMTLNRKTDYTLLNKAIDYSNATVSFSVSDSSLSGKVSSDGLGKSTVTVGTITLDNICTAYDFGKYTLISDIEGAEITILLNDEPALKKCGKMIIELHDTVYGGKKYSIKDMTELIISNGFALADQERAVFVFIKNK